MKYGNSPPYIKAPTRGAGEATGNWTHRPTVARRSARQVSPRRGGRGPGDLGEIGEAGGRAGLVPGPRSGRPLHARPRSAALTVKDGEPRVCHGRIGEGASTSTASGSSTPATSASSASTTSSRWPAWIYPRKADGCDPLADDRRAAGRRLLGASGRRQGPGAPRRSAGSTTRCASRPWTDWTGPTGTTSWSPTTARGWRRACKV